MTLGNSWKYHSSEQFKSAREVIHMLADTSAKGGNLLLGVGPDPRGRIPTGAVRRLAEIGAWLRVNGEAIYGTRSLPPCQSGAARFTRKDGHGYAIVLDPAMGPDRRLTVPGIRPAAGSQVMLLGDGQSRAWEPAAADGFRVQLPEPAATGADAVVIRFCLAGK